MNKFEFEGEVCFPFGKTREELIYSGQTLQGQKWRKITFQVKTRSGWIDCESFEGKVIDSLKAGALVNLTNYEPRKESWTNKAGVKQYRTIMLVKELIVMEEMTLQTDFELPNVEEDIFGFKEELKEEKEALEELSLDDMLKDLKDLL